MSKKAASKGMQSALLAKKYQKQGMLHVQGKLTLDSPQFIIGYHDLQAHAMCVLLTEAASVPTTVLLLHSSFIAIITVSLFSGHC